MCMVTYKFLMHQIIIIIKKYILIKSFKMFSFFILHIWKLYFVHRLSVLN